MLNASALGRPSCFATAFLPALFATGLRGAVSCALSSCSSLWIVAWNHVPVDRRTEAEDGRFCHPDRSFTLDISLSSCEELTFIALSLRKRVTHRQGQLYRLAGVGGLSDFREEGSPSLLLSSEGVVSTDFGQE